MKTITMLAGFVAIFLIGAAFAFKSNSAKCKIVIEDVRKGATFTIEHQFVLNKTENSAQRKHFEIPGNDYACTLAFFGLKNGTMFSCEYKKDFGETFFQSDRSVIKESDPANNLTFRHKGAFISIKTKCN
ncbi:MAG: hypothetical protein ABII74_10310 [Elusimicrobiota bacterium]